MNRREFLKSTGAVAVAGALPIPAAKAAVLTVPPVGTVAYADLAAKIKDWTDHFEFEFLKSTVVGMRGDNPYS